jgi:hypothetical protein
MTASKRLPGTEGPSGIARFKSDRIADCSCGESCAAHEVSQYELERQLPSKIGNCGF